MKPITVLISEDHMILRDGLRALLENEQDIDIIGEASNGREAVDICQQLRPEVVVMDIHMPQLNGMEATRQILHTLPNTKVLILSASSDPMHLEELLHLGISGYVMKQTAASFLSTAIRAVRNGETYFSPAIARHLLRLNRGTGSSGSHPAPAQLTSREAEVLQLVAEGKANKEIAAELHISVKTVEKHRHSLMYKLDIHETAGLTRYAIGRGIVDTEVRVAIADH